MFFSCQIGHRHSEEPAIELSFFTDADQVYNRLQIVVDHTGWNPTEERKRAIMGFKDHFLALPWIADHKTLAAIGQAEMRDLDSLDNTSNLNPFMSPDPMGMNNG